MRHINEVASWFNKNNILKVDEVTDNLRIALLCLYTKTAYEVNNIELICDEIKINGLNIDIGITDTNLDTNFNEEELHILKTINHYYGYLKMEDLLYDITRITEEPTIKNIVNNSKEEVTQVLQNFELYEFKEKVLLINDKVFFVLDEVNINEDLIKELEDYTFEDQYIFTVFENKDSKSVVIF